MDLFEKQKGSKGLEDTDVATIREFNSSVFEVASQDSLCIWLHVEQLKPPKMPSVLDQKYFSRCHFEITNSFMVYFPVEALFGTMLIINSSSFC